MCYLYHLLLLGISINYVVGKAELSCPSLDLDGSLITKRDTILKGHVRQSLPDVSMVHCSLRCQRQHWCISINFQIIPNTGECELNDYGVQDEMSMSKEGRFERRPGFVYTQLRPAKFGCQSNTCYNGGTCEIKDCNTGSKICICSAGYRGDRCEIDINECFSSPCQKGGTCTDQVNGYTCTCVAGHTGLNCETDIKECSSNPCQNGGTCTDQVNGYNCTCVTGFNGSNCETNINECSSSPCQNGGTCTDLVNGYNCTCVAGFNGSNCETNIDECSSSPCENGGTCIDQVNGYNCTCVAGYNGVNCEKSINECSSNPCQNGGVCTDQVNGYNCTCVVGHTGLNCETDIKECSSSPCKNGGTCTDQVNGYNCTCVAGYTGLNCQNLESDCELEWPSKSTANYVKGDWLTSQSLSTFTVSVWLKVPQSFDKEIVPFSYATNSETEALRIKIKPDKNAEIKLMGDAKTCHSGLTRNSTWQHLAVTWDRNNVADKGTVLFYHNGNAIDNKKDLSKNNNLQSGGVIIVGQKQGSLDGGFDKDKLMVGYMAGLNIWSRVFTGNEVKELHQKCKSSQSGDVVSWTNIINKTLHGNVKKNCPSTCSP